MYEKCARYQHASILYTLSHLVFIVNRLVDVDSILLVAIVDPTVLPVTFVRPPVGEPEELGVGGIATKRHHFLEGRVFPEKVNMKSCKKSTIIWWMKSGQWNATWTPGSPDTGIPISSFGNGKHITTCFFYRFQKCYNTSCSPVCPWWRDWVPHQSLLWVKLGPSHLVHSGKEVKKEVKKKV